MTAARFDRALAGESQKSNLITPIFPLKNGSPRSSGGVRVERATSAGDRALDVAETPLEALALRSLAAGHDRLVLEPSISEPAEAAEAVAHDARVGCNAAL